MANKDIFGVYKKKKPKSSETGMASEYTEELIGRMVATGNGLTENNDAGNAKRPEPSPKRTSPDTPDKHTAPAPGQSEEPLKMSKKILPKKNKKRDMFGILK